MDRYTLEYPVIEIRALDRKMTEQLARFFCTLKESGDEHFFHPHPLTGEEATKRCNYEGKDLYYALTEGHEVLGYGMLRGWDAGYEIPSLGIAIHPTARGLGLGRLLMQFLHAAACRRSANRVRLKVYSDNIAAIKFYKRLGYEFQSNDKGLLIGYIDL